MNKRLRLILKIAALLCKVPTILFWLWMAWVKVDLDIANLQGNAGPWGDPDWGTSAFFRRTYLEIVMLVALALLAILPNRWLVFSRLAFGVSLVIALIPFCELFASPSDWSDLLFAALFALLPASLILSFWRQRKGEKIGYV